MNFSLENARVGIIGLGYVGLPLAVEFGKKAPTIGFDINQARIDELSAGRDSTLECSDNELAEAKYLSYTSSLQELKECNVYIVTVPTPIDEHKQPDLTPLIKASEALGTVVNQGDIIVYESTVYPGATEEDCIPVVERVSGLKFNQDFFAGYSPERINPGDKENRLTTIKKVTSGSTEEVANFVDELYNSIISAGTHRASSIKVAEASKVIENVQRDVNIALINELHQIFERLGIDTKEVIEAAATKWNFMKLMPGLVGGHCIGVDPYYLLHKSETTGYVPDLMRTAREINNGMVDYIATNFMKSIIKEKINPINLKVVILGFSFKENCPDLRNTKIFDLYKELVSLGFDVDVYDPWVDPKEVEKEYGIYIKSQLAGEYDVAMLMVGHDCIVEEIKRKEISLKYDFIYDFKGFLN
ncbi:TPA: nucleotide sugar dehydrogenase [Vibrio parahaemolyticus]|uniref:nucleotide sugar dehydrogenase n=1 Tax=Vibrio parahaemolyticus TaxID=670 RepID=UPI00064A3B5F|nr:nucleotide sugar dehydrogenase [Vibrio parahaemolyticus]EGR1983694.1 nucleotide sugar dehydrogenase [Vibrio parahaemolyticus]EII3441688.1 nucleotide sugar dehydrogenase [Vibrio parahaemolyticus]ELA7840488.1 nucleotide sugar dehydrogenase [Vibrio parahaemolyticus]OXD35640.1 nucleotide sugar dehydrogenase [Vibrio parahaemolyticus]HAS6807359.1 nucleotide sugar dehydrogenase [Vibrio parahaemolyticus]